MKNKNTISLKHKAILVMLFAALLASCENLISRKPNDAVWGGYEQGENSGSGSLTVTARVSNGSSRHAMPTIPELVYAAALYKSVESSEYEKFEPGTKATDSDNLIFSFQKPDDTNGTFTLEVFAFKAGTAAADFSREGALFCGKTGCEIRGDKINVGDIALEVNSSSTEKGTVNLKITVPEGCSLEIDDTTRFAVTGTSPNFTLTQKDASGISAGAYPVTFTVKKVDDTDDAKEEIIHIFTEYINVINGLCTDTWNGSEKGAAKVITQGMISSTVYVRGSGEGWYKTSPYNETAVASDTNSGSFLAPLATIQKAVNTVIARNDGTSKYTIYIDGTLTLNETPTNGMADFSHAQNLNLTIKALSGTATLDANQKSRVINAAPASGTLNLTLENLVITNGKVDENGGGIYAGNSATLTLKTCAIKSCETTSISYDTGGGGICNEGAAIEIEGGEISGCKAEMNGGGIFVYDGTFTMSGSIKISGNEAEKGGGVYTRVGTFTMNGGTVGGGTAGDANTATYGGGIYVGSYGAIKASTFRMEGGTITGNSSYGVYMNGGYFYMSGAAKVESNNIVYGNSSNPIYISGALTATPPVATFNLSSYGVDRTVLCADTDVTINEDICNKIAPTAEGCKIVPSADGTKGVLKVHTIFLNSESGNDYMYNGVSTSNAAKTLSKAIEQYDTYNAEKIMVCAPYTLPSGETTLLDRTGKSKLTLMRYAGSGDGSGAFTGNLLEISEGNVPISNVTLDGNKENVKASGSLLYIDGATVTLGTDATLCNNETTSINCSGGVTINSGTFEMTGGAITGNIANRSSGGGVYVDSDSTFNMSGGEISGNEAEMGGGVNICYNGTFAMSGGTISGNNASFGSGVYDNGIFRMTDAAKVESDNDVYLSTGRTIRAASLTASAPVATITPSTYASNTKVLLSSAGGPPSTATCNKFAVKPDSDSNQWKVSFDGTSAAGVLKMAN